MENKKFWAYAFSLLPGAGHLYIGVQKKGLQLMSCFLGAAFLGELTNLHIFNFLMPIIWFYSIFDVRKILYLGTPIDDSLSFDFNFNGKLPKIIAYGFIIIGVWSLLHNMVFPILNINIDYHIENYVKTAIGSFILIFFGLKLLSGNKRLLLPHKKGGQ
ncbi:hypothetical protein [Clostridium oceanicum]|uniref:TM2 domain protein n=1 Tax=Clostridium oceanicum TaxID=1543 RepID=A0ABN1JBN6_9CLOT